jgi:hypothetical protein
VLLNNIELLPCYFHKKGLLLHHLSETFTFNNQPINIARIERKFEPALFIEDELMARTLKTLFGSVKTRFQGKQRANIRHLKNLSSNGVLTDIRSIINGDIVNNVDGELFQLMGGVMDGELSELLDFLVLLERLTILMSERLSQANANLLLNIANTLDTVLFQRQLLRDTARNLANSIKSILQEYNHTHISFIPQELSLYFNYALSKYIFKKTTYLMSPLRNFVTMYRRVTNVIEPTVIVSDDFYDSNISINLIPRIVNWPQEYEFGPLQNVNMPANVNLANTTDYSANLALFLLSSHIQQPVTMLITLRCALIIEEVHSNAAIDLQNCDPFTLDYLTRVRNLIKNINFFEINSV